MNELIKHLTDTNFRDLAGSSLEGQLAMSDELVNLGLADLLKNLTSPAPASAPASSSPAVDSAPPIDPKLLLQRATIHHLKYRTEAGRTILEIRAELPDHA